MADHLNPRSTPHVTPTPQSRGMAGFAQEHPILWAFLFFSYFSLVYQVLIYTSGMSGTVGIRDSLLMSTLWVVPLLFFPKYSRFIAAMIGLFLWAAALSCLGYWMIYGQDFSQSAIFIIFESNTTESREFIQSYLEYWHVIIYITFSVIAFKIWRLMPPITLPRKTRYSYILLFSLIVSWPFIGTLLQTNNLAQASYHQIHRLEPAAPWNLVVGYIKYRHELTNMEKLLADNKRIRPLQNLNINLDKMPDTLVLVIGESTNRQRMSLYEYPRKTTPRLDALRDEITVFNDVVTPRPYTIEALQQALSFADEKNPDAFFTQPTLLNMMKQAGYEITWITNQQTQTRRNTMLTTLSQMADHQVYLNNNRSQNASQYDGKVIAPFKNALAQSGKKKMIVVHLLGTHRKYDYRYPKSFEKFTNKQGVPEWVSPSDIYEYNSYDNAVAYNDDVLANLIDSVKQHNDNALLVYFSDHGEEVYDSPEKQFTGRNEAAPTEAMYTVPFITWASPKWKANGNAAQWQQYTNRPFTIADFIHTLPDMLGINFEGLDHSRSLVSDAFIARTRWIGNPLDPKSLKAFSHIKKTAVTQSETTYIYPRPNQTTIGEIL